MRRILALVLVALTAGCRSGPGRASAFDPVGHWRLAMLSGERLTGPTMVVEPDGSVGGRAGVNRWSSRIDPAAWDQGAFVLGDIATTRMAGEPRAMELERRYLDALRRADGYLPGNRTLELLDGREVLMRFEREE